MTICIGRPIIQILADQGAWSSADGESVVAADELFKNDPYAEIERLRKEIEQLKSDARPYGEL